VNIFQRGKRPLTRFLLKNPSVFHILFNYKYLFILKYISFLLILSFAACNENTESSQKPIVTSQEDSIKNTLTGRWGGLGESSPVWEIRNDSIYFFEHLRAYPYKMVNHDLIINQLTHEVKLGNIYVIKDTLFFLDERGVLIKGYRFK